MKKAGMILEGGGTRGVFTAGVLDYFMEQGMYLPYVIGVSAGACNAVDYASHQPGRMKLCTIDFLEAGSYVGLKSLVKTHSLFNMDLIFDIFPNKIIPFDYDTYFSSGMECILTATNALTGKAEYLSEKSDRQRPVHCNGDVSDLWLFRSISSRAVRPCGIQGVSFGAHDLR